MCGLYLVGFINYLANVKLTPVTTDISFFSYIDYTHYCIPTPAKRSLARNDDTRLCIQRRSYYRSTHSATDIRASDTSLVATCVDVPHQQTDLTSSVFTTEFVFFSPSVSLKSRDVVLLWAFFFIDSSLFIEFQMNESTKAMGDNEIVFVNMGFEILILFNECVYKIKLISRCVLIIYYYLHFKM